MLIHFDRAAVTKLLDHAFAAKRHAKDYGQKGRASPGLILVGDEGIYLMSNGLPMLQTCDSTKNFVVYARECDPTTMAFEVWWEAKNRIFGGDDGGDTMPAKDIRLALSTYPPDGPLVLDVTPSSVGLIAYRDVFRG